MKHQFAAAAFAVALVASPVHAASGLDCLDRGYAAAEQAQIDRFHADFSFEKFSNDATSDQVLDPLIQGITNRAAACSQQNRWSDPAFEQAMYYKIYSSLARAMERRAPVAQAVVVKIKAGTTGADRLKLKQIFLPTLASAGTGAPAPGISAEHEAFIEQFLTRNGIPTDQVTVEFFGAWVAAELGAEVAFEKFAKE